MSAPEFIDFVNRSPTPFHAVATVVEQLKAAGYKKLPERESWAHITAHEKYYVTRNASAIIAFETGKNWKRGNGLAIVGAHTDSPTFQLKPRSNIRRNGYVQLGLETYGGGIWPTWMDRDLSVAGRVFVRNGAGETEARLVKIEKPLLRIPTLPIHLKRSQGETLEINKEQTMRAVLALQGDEVDTATHPTGLMGALAKELQVSVEDIDFFDLYLYDTQKSVIGGLNDEFIFSPRLDNLVSCYCAVKALIEAPKDVDSVSLVALFDNEEVGSESMQGAKSNFLQTVIERLNSRQSDADAVEVNLGAQAAAKSFLISADQAHAVHPNYTGIYEENHHAQINQGPAIKVHNGQKYTTTGYSRTALSRFAELGNVPTQVFIVRNDSRCGSTIGPFVASKLGVPAIDLGNPQLSMHSAREMGGSKDLTHLTNLFLAFFEHFTRVTSKIDYNG